MPAPSNYECFKMTVSTLGSGPATRELEGCLAAIEAHNASINALITVMPDSALAEARAADLAQSRGEWRGLLHGVSTTIKDCFNLTGVRTTFGSALYRDNISDSDSEVVRRMRQHAPVIVGKNNLTEFCYGATGDNPHFGRNRNPWDTDRITGGSSSGSATAVAAGMCRVSLGSDTGGSVRIPAALCGVVGLRPTVGRISGANALGASVTFDTIGPMAYGVADVARTYAAVAGFNRDDPGSVDRPVDDIFSGLHAGVRGLRIGLPRSFFFEDLEPGVETAVMEAAKTLEAQGAQLVDVDLPDAAAMHTTVLFSLVTSDMADLHRVEMEENSDRIGAEVLRRLRLGLDVSGRDYAHALRLLRTWSARFRPLFDQFDVILTPTAPIVAPKWADSEDMIETTRQVARFTYAIGATGLPSLTVPCGFGAGRMPVGMQLVANWFDEAMLFRVGQAFQQRTEFHRVRPRIGASSPQKELANGI